MASVSRAIGGDFQRGLLNGASLIAGAVALVWPGAVAAQTAANTSIAPSGQEVQPAPAATPPGRPDAIPVDQSDAPPASSSDVVVTGSRAIRDGSQAPTPVTVLSADQLNQAAPSSVADALTQVPVFPQSHRPTSAGSSGTGLNGNGGNFLNLRGLDPVRTLILLDGRRTVPSNRTGSVDVNTLPQLLVKRVDVVTGGASAAYGSDAVAGVVNFVLDTQFEGVKGVAQAGVSTYGDAASYKASLAVGHHWLDGRLSLVASAEYYDNNGVGLDYGGRGWANSGYGAIPNSTGGPTTVFAPDVARSDSAAGGLITGTSALAGTQFGPGGSVLPFTFGQYRSASVMSGGDGPRSRTNLASSLNEQSYFLHAAFQDSPAFKPFLELGYSVVRTAFPATFPGNFGATQFTIYRDNAFLPTTIRDRMTQLGLASIPVGRFSSDWGVETDATNTRTFRLATGAQGDLGASWHYNAYYTFGITRGHLETRNDPIQLNVYNGVDSVVSPATGQVVCRSTLTAPDNGCVPINIFGPGATSAAGIDYATGLAEADLRQTQNVASLTINGEPFRTWAGPVSLAFGGEYRRIAADQRVDPISARINSAGNIRGVPTSLVGSVGGFKETNPQPLAGAYSVREAFVEVAIPLASHVALADSLDLNGAVRYADYSSVGGTLAWKVGGVYAPIRAIRLRATRSRDIRAPNISELFTQSQQTTGVGVRDPAANNTTVVVTRYTTGNAALQEERADTTTYGMVLQPVSGLSLSFDRYRIKIDGAITTIGIQQVADGCAAGVTSYCPLIRRNPTTNAIISVTTPTLNIASLSTSGFDVEASYRTDLSRIASSLPGSLALRGLLTKIDKLVTTSPSGRIDRAGSLGQNDSVPDLIFNVSALYSAGPWSAFAQVRHIAGGQYDSTLTSAQLDPNHVAARTYVDATLTHRLKIGGAAVDLFLTVNNLLDRDPPLAPTGSVTTPRYTNGFLYDEIGRYFTGGVKFAF